VPEPHPHATSFLPATGGRRSFLSFPNGIIELMPERDLNPAIDSFVAIGDSFTEGLQDPDPGGGFLGWADRMAGVLSAQRPGFRYANLAIRGKRLGEVVAEQLPRAVELAPDLVSLAAGGNDILCGTDVDVLASEFEPAVAKLQAAGCRVLIFTGFDPRMFPVIRLLRGRIAAYNMHLRGIADEYGCDLVDLWSMRVLKDPRAWSPDRLHLTTEGHRRVALRACEVLGVPVAGDWRAPLSPEPLVPALRVPVPANRARWQTQWRAQWRAQLRTEWLVARRDDARWAREYAAPWVRRRFGGTSSGDGVPPKRPDLLPIQ
jgi:lysophospholipase L1-like esterase